MSQVSKKVLNPKITQRLFENFWEMLANIKNPNDIKIFLEDFLSPTEKIMLAKRMAIAILFSKNYDHRSIASILKVSTSTVNNIARQLAIQTPGYQLLIKKYLDKQATREFLEELGRIFYRFSSPGKSFMEEDAIRAKFGHRKKVF